MSAAVIAAALGNVHREGREWRCRCPIHGGMSLTLRDGEDGRLLVWCFGGCDARDVLAEFRRRGLLDDRRRDYRTVPPAHLPKRPDRADQDRQRIAQALRLWNEAQPAASTVVERYLGSRVIDIAPPSVLRFHAHCPHPNGVKLPAMLALVERERIGPVAVHRTFLKADGSGKAAVEIDKASLGPVGGGAVRLAVVRPGTELVLAEGIETTLSVMVATGLPGWSCLSAGGIEKVALPPKATAVVIAADNDANGVGQRAAEAAAQRFLAEGRIVRVATPPVPGTDFNDVLTGALPAVIEEARYVA